MRMGRIHFIFCASFKLTENASEKKNEKELRHNSFIVLFLISSTLCDAFASLYAFPLAIVLALKIAKFCNKKKQMYIDSVSIFLFFVLLSLLFYIVSRCRCRRRTQFRRSEKSRNGNKTFRTKIHKNWILNKYILESNKMKEEKKN